MAAEGRVFCRCNRRYAQSSWHLGPPRSVKNLFVGLHAGRAGGMYEPPGGKAAAIGMPTGFSHWGRGLLILLLMIVNSQHIPRGVPHYPLPLVDSLHPESLLC